MATNIDDLSVFGDYKDEENKLTAAFLQVLRRGGEPLIRHVSIAADFVLPVNEIEILSQVTEEGCTPDGLMRSRFSFSLYVESKRVPAAINKKQLRALVGLADRDTRTTVLYLTPDVVKPSALEGQPVAWMSWRSVQDSFEEFLNGPDAPDDDVLSFLVENFSTFAERLGVFGESWAPPEGSVLVVPANSSWKLNDAYRVYTCPNNRSFRPSEWVAFYVNGTIRRAYKIEGAPEKDVVPEQDDVLREFFRKSPFTSQAEPHIVFRLGEREDVGPVMNDQVDRAGKRCAYVQGKRYTTIERLRAATRTSQL